MFRFRTLARIIPALLVLMMLAACATVPMTGDWQPLRDGIEVRFNDFEWEKGYTVVFAARSQLVTRIEKVEGKTAL